MNNSLVMIVCVRVCWWGCLGAMENKQPDYDLKELIIRIDQLEKSVNRIQQNQDQLQRPENITITLSLQELLELQRKQQSQSVPTVEQSSLIQVPQNQQIQPFNSEAHNERMQNLENGIQALAQGQPYRAWHYFGAVATGTGGIAAIMSVIYIIMWCVQVYGHKTTP